MAWSMCSSGAAIYKAGANADSTAIASASILAEWSNEIEGWINAETRHDWISTPATANFTGILKSVAASLIGNNIIAYNMSGYTSRTEAQTMLDVNRDIATQGLKVLSAKENQEKMI